MIENFNISIAHKITKARSHRRGPTEAQQAEGYKELRIATQA